ncbi:MAG: PAS domain S-box protein, partial [Chloroflexi bacterium]|nr:PAS domain S-box protein [Chloroflexota bacterium]
LSSPQPLPVDQAKRFLVESVREYPTVLHFSWVGSDGRVLVSSAPDHIGRDISGSPYFGDVLQGHESVISDIFREDPGDQVVFAIARGVRDDRGALQGTVVAMVDPQRLGGLLAVQRTEQGRIGIVDRNGFLVYRYPEASLEWQERDWAKIQPNTKQALAGQEVTGTFIWPADTRVWIGGITPIRSIGWAASAGRPEAAVMAPLVQDLLRDTGLHLFVAGVALPAAILIGRSFTVPVSRLRQHALAFGHGELDRRAEVVGITELDDLAGAFNGMAEEISARQEALSQLAAIVEFSEEAIISTATDGTIVSWNPGAERLYGYSAEEVKGQSVSLIFPAGQEEELPEILERIGRGERIERYETARVRKDGRRVDVSVTMSPIKDAAGRNTGASTMARDITEREREVERLRNELLSTISHELRTPLTLIRTCIGLLLDSDPDGIMRERLLRNIKQSTDRMHALVTDLLDLVRLRSGRVELQVRWVDIGELVAGAAALMRPLLEEKNQVLGLDLPQQAPRVLGDYRRLEQALLNLLSNANKFAPSGAKVGISAFEDEDSVTIAVVDTGPGIPAEARVHLFEQFYTARTSSLSHSIGAGLGLPIAKGIVEAHGGRIWFESELGIGSAFYFAVPKEGPSKDGLNEDTSGG